MKKTRFLYFDLIKTIAIFLVCLYHSHTLNLDYLMSPTTRIYMNNFIISFASMGVPLFFLVNGALMLSSKLTLKKHIKKITKIIIISVVWIFITLILTAIIYDTRYISLGELVNELWFWPPGTLNHFWYIFSLVHIYIYYPIIKVAFENKINIYYFVITIFILTFGNNFINILRHILEYLFNTKILEIIDFNYFFRVNFTYDTYFFVGVYFIVGGIIFGELKKEDGIFRFKYFKSKYLMIIFILSNISLLGYTMIVSKVYGYRYDPVWNGYSTIFTFIMSIVFFIICFKLESKLKKIEKLIVFIGSNTLGIYFIHMILIYQFKSIFSQYKISQYIGGNIIFTIFILGVSLIIISIIKRIPLLRKLV